MSNDEGEGCLQVAGALAAAAASIEYVSGRIENIGVPGQSALASASYHIEALDQIASDLLRELAGKASMKLTDHDLRHELYRRMEA